MVTSQDIAQAQQQAAAQQQRLAQAKTQLTSQQNLRSASRQGMSQIKSASGQISRGQQQLASQQAELKQAAKEVKAYEEQVAKQEKYNTALKEVQKLAGESQGGFVTYDASVGDAIKKFADNAGITYEEAKQYYSNVAMSAPEYQKRAADTAVRQYQAEVIKSLPSDAVISWDKYGTAQGFKTSLQEAKFIYSGGQLTGISDITKGMSVPIADYRIQKTNTSNIFTQPKQTLSTVFLQQSKQPQLTREVKTIYANELLPKREETISERATREGGQWISTALSVFGEKVAAVPLIRDVVGVSTYVAISGVQKVYTPDKPLFVKATSEQKAGIDEAAMFSIKTVASIAPYYIPYVGSALVIGEGLQIAANPNQKIGTRLAGIGMAGLGGLSLYQSVKAIPTTYNAYKLGLSKTEYAVLKSKDITSQAYYATRLKALVNQQNKLSTTKFNTFLETFNKNYPLEGKVSKIPYVEGLGKSATIELRTGGQLTTAQQAKSLQIEVAREKALARVGQYESTFFEPVKSKTVGLGDKILSNKQIEIQARNFLETPYAKQIGITGKQEAIKYIKESLVTSGYSTGKRLPNLFYGIEGYESIPTQQYRNLAKSTTVTGGWAGYGSTTQTSWATGKQIANQPYLFTINQKGAASFYKLDKTRASVLTVGDLKVYKAPRYEIVSIERAKVGAVKQAKFGNIEFRRYSPSYGIRKSEPLVGKKLYEVSSFDLAPKKPTVITRGSKVKEFILTTEQQPYMNVKSEAFVNKDYEIIKTTLDKGIKSNIVRASETTERLKRSLPKEFTIVSSNEYAAPSRLITPKFQEYAIAQQQVVKFPSSKLFTTTKLITEQPVLNTYITPKVSLIKTNVIVSTTTKSAANLATGVGVINQLKFDNAPRLDFTKDILQGTKEIIIAKNVPRVATTPALDFQQRVTQEPTLKIQPITQLKITPNITPKIKPDIIPEGGKGKIPNFEVEDAYLKYLKKKKRKTMFEAFSKRFGKELSLGRFESQEGAEKKLGTYLRGTLAASGKIKQEGIVLPFKSLKSFKSMEFRQAKRDSFTVVQRREFRLGTGTEKREIKQAKRKLKVW